MASGSAAYGVAQSDYRVPTKQKNGHGDSGSGLMPMCPFDSGLKAAPPENRESCGRHTTLPEEKKNGKARFLVSGVRRRTIGSQTRPVYDATAEALKR